MTIDHLSLEEIEAIDSFGQWVAELLTITGVYNEVKAKNNSTSGKVYKVSRIAPVHSVSG